MAQKDYYMLYHLIEGDPIDINESMGPAPLLIDNVVNHINNIDEFQLMENETKKIIAQYRGDAIIIKGIVPASFSLLIKAVFSKEVNMAVNRKKSAETENKAAEQAQALAIEVLRAKDFTEAAEIAALNSKAEGENIAVDYTYAKNVKKTPSSKPGFVIYHTNWTAYVTPDKEKTEKLRIK